ncbi:ABC-type transport auxiliary lipoprotein family protein [Legionella fallonii]|nr:ABC-type transport auxiliary lipoprotein family protein [Legionella fallonii]
MRLLNSVFLSIGILSLVGCSPVKTLATNEYQLSAFSTKQFTSKPRAATLVVTAPEAVAGYQTEQMLYVKKPYQIEAFAKNEWASPPAEMLYPLLVQSLQRTGYFYAVASSLYNVEADYRLDTQLLNLEQNFLKKPSVMDVTVKIVLTRVADNKVMGSRIITQHVTCPTDTPYGGVVAANKATHQLTAIVADFVISHSH